MSLVIDASIMLAWLFVDEDADAARTVLRHVAAHSAVVPSLWPLEVANALQMAIRRKRIDEALRDSALVDLNALDITVDADTDRVACTSTLQLAKRYQLTTYDAA